MKMTKTDLESLNISTRLLAERALDRGYELSYFAASVGGETGVMVCRKNNTELRFKSTATALSPAFGYFTAEDKILTSNLLEGHGVPTPKTYEVAPGNIPAELDFARHSYVVKPTAMNHGDGVTVGVDSQEKLEVALDFALKASGVETAIVQEQVSGNEYRFLVLEKKVVAVAGRQPASVVGDGSSTIQRLIELKNQDPRRGEGHKASLTKISLQDVENARGKDFLSTVPGEGEKVSLLDTSNLSKGGEAVDYTDIASDILKEIAVDAASACSLGLAGVDIMTDDIVAPSEGKSFVIEVNLAPGLRMHHFPSEGTPRDVADMIFKKLERHAKRKYIKKDIIPVSTFVDFVDLKGEPIPARVDSGARTSSLWVSDIKLEEGGRISFCLLGPASRFYTGERVEAALEGSRVVTNSMGGQEERYMVRLRIRMNKKLINAKFTLSNRSMQTYPILIGRNTLRGSFVVDSLDPGEAALFRDEEERTDFTQIEAL